MIAQEITTAVLISRALDQIDAAIAQVQPAQLDSGDALSVWESLEPAQQQLEATLNRLEDLMVALVDRMEG
ncbi:MAG: hypothetical protein SNJ50_20705 [Cyanobacteriota bacterium]